MDSLWAEEVLRERGGGLSADDIYTVTWLATGSKDKAEDAKTDRLMREMRRTMR